MILFLYKQVVVVVVVIVIVVVVIIIHNVYTVFFIMCAQSAFLPFCIPKLVQARSQA